MLFRSEFISQIEVAKTEEERSWIIIKILLDSLSPELSEAVWAAAIPHWFNPEILAALCPGLESTIEKLYEKLQELSFVEEFPGRGYNIHDSTRKQMLTHLWSKDPERFCQLSKNAANYFAQHNNQPELQIEWLYHLIVTNPDQAAEALAQVIYQWLNSFRIAELDFLKNRLLERVELDANIIFINQENDNLKQKINRQLEILYTGLFRLIEALETKSIKALKQNDNLSNKARYLEYQKLRQIGRAHV